MPIFDKPPTVFPPIVAPVDSLGDVPAFAFAFGEDVVAWTPPDPFRYRDSDYLFDMREPTRSLHVHVMRRWSSATVSAVTQIEEQAQESRRNLQRLVEESSRPDPYVIVVRTSDEVRWVKAEYDELHIDWRGEVIAQGSSSPIGLQSVTTIVGDDGRLARALKVKGDDRPHRDRLWPIAEVRAQLRNALGGRNAWAPEDALLFWVIDVGFGVNTDWTPVPSRRTITGNWDPAGNGEPLEWCEVEFRLPVKLSEIDVATILDEDTNGTDSFRRRIEVTSSSVPGHGHGLLRGCEIRRHPETYIPELEPDEEPGLPGEDDPISYPGETLRIAVVQVGRDHAVELRLRIADAAVAELEPLWKQVMDRLYVSKCNPVVEGT